MQYLSSKDEWKATNELLNKYLLSEIIEGKNQIDSNDFVSFEAIRRDVWIILYKKAENTYASLDDTTLRRINSTIDTIASNHTKGSNI